MVRENCMVDTVKACLFTQASAEYVYHLLIKKEVKNNVNIELCHFLH